VLTAFRGRRVQGLAPAPLGSNSEPGPISRNASHCKLMMDKEKWRAEAIVVPGGAVAAVHVHRITVHGSRMKASPDEAFGRVRNRTVASRS
jgi:hypothetical protein